MRKLEMPLKAHPEYEVWKGMRSRCSRPSVDSFKYYGARGIRVCDRWLHSFVNFYSDMGPRPSPAHSLDRINNNGNYEPSNCRWATAREQTLNSRVTKLSLEKAGIIRSMAETGMYQYEIARLFNVDQSLISLVVNKKTWVD